MLGPFFARPIAIQRWARIKGYDGTAYDAIYAYFQSNSALNSGTLYDHIIHSLNRNGYYGTIYDCLKSFFQDKTGIIGRIDSEKAFWENTSLDFFDGIGSGDAILTEDGNYILTEDGGRILLE